MSLRVRFRFHGKCCVHPRYNPENDGRPKDKTCPGCDSLYVIWLYTGIARRKAENGEGLAQQMEPEAAGENTAQSLSPRQESLGTPETTATTNLAEFVEGETS
jgi:hypothetical protein